MDLEQVKQFISEQGWTPLERPKRNGTRYLYATRRDTPEWRHMTWRYIAPVAKLDRVTEEEILAILSRVETR